jgi:hypothetical protein
MDIKAIETNYKGYKFRSRLEARWAVFFDAAEIKWEYEPEGYVTSKGDCYLPDFYLPEENLFVEVKGIIPDDDGYEKLSTFSLEKGTPILLVCGIMGEGACEIFIPRVGIWKNCFIGVNSKNKELIFLYGGYLSEDEALDVIAEDYKKKVGSARTAAINAMKQARFEFL